MLQIQALYIVAAMTKRSLYKTKGILLGTQK